MKTYSVPDWMVGPFVKNGFSENDHYLYGAGRALGFVRMAAYALDDPTYDTETIGHPLKVAEYHAYTGISAARTAIDATASWCNVVLDLGLKPGTQVSLTKKAFRTKVSKASPGVATYAQALSELGEKIDEHRQRAQHREGLAIIYHMDSQKLGHPGGWYLAIGGDHTADLRLVDLLNGWFDEIEENLREIHKVLVLTQCETQEM